MSQSSNVGKNKSKKRKVMKTPEQMEVWEHHNGIRYVILGIANEGNPSDNYPLTVVHVNEANDTLWTRPLDQWHRSFKLISGADEFYGQF